MAVTQASGGAGTVLPRTSTDQGNITAPDAGDLNAAARAYCTIQGWSMADGSYPVRPANNHGAADLDKAVHAVGRGNASGDTIRRHIIARAHAIGLASAIPDTWSAKGSLTDSGTRAADVLDLPGLDLDRKHFRIATDLELRSGGDGRTIVGIAVPYNRVQRINDQLTEAFLPGAFDHQIRAMHRVGYWNLHSIHGGSEVGHIKEARDDASGLYTESYVRRGDEGDRTLDEIRSGRSPQQSIGFESGTAGTQLRDGVAYRAKADLFELAAVPIGAYGASASIAEVRSAARACPNCGNSANPASRDRLHSAMALLAGLPTMG